ncbi:MAG: hypothetical protein U0894_04000 [Pirellulales bacterium]
MAQWLAQLRLAFLRNSPLGACLLCLLLVKFAFADKLVVEGTNGTLLNREGVIVDIVGSELRLQMLSGKVDTIPISKVKRIDASDDAAGQACEKLVQAGNFRQVILPLQKAISTESRPWRQRQLRQQLIVCHHELGEIASAGDEFLLLVASDPSTLAWNIAPLAWSTNPVPPDMEARAEKWLAARNNPAAQLLGASWLLPTAKRGTAIATLQALASNPTPADPRISAQAEMQLWRTKIVTAKPTDVSNWQQAIDQVPSEIRSGPLFVLADALAYTKQPEAAALAYLKIPLLYDTCRPLCAEALLAAARQEHVRGESTAAVRLLQELQKKYPLSPAAEEAKSDLKTWKVTP